MCTATGIGYPQSILTAGNPHQLLLDSTCRRTPSYFAREQFKTCTTEVFVLPMGKTEHHQVAEQCAGPVTRPLQRVQGCMKIF